MPLTYEGIDELYAKKLITPQERATLRQKFLQDQNQITSLTSKFISHLSGEVSNNWAAMLASLKETGAASAQAAEAKPDKSPVFGTETTKYDAGVVMAAAATGWHALSLLMSPVTAAGKASGEQIQDYLIKAGANDNVAAVVATLTDLGIQGRGMQVASAAAGLVKANVLKQAVKTIVPEATIAKATAIVEKQNPANLVDVIRPPQDLPLPNKGGVVQTPRLGLPAPEAPIVEKSVPAATPSAKSQIDVIRESQDTALPGKAGTIVAPRQALPPPASEEALRKSVQEAADSRMQAMTDTHDLLSQAQEQIMPAAKTETQKTLDAAAATLRGGSTPEQVLNTQQMTQTSNAVDELLQGMKTSKFAVRGGAPGPADYASRFNEVVKAYGAQLERYQGHGLSREMAEQQASKLLSQGYGLGDIMAIMPQEAQNPAQTLAVIKTAMPMAERVMKLREGARTDPEAFQEIIGNMTSLLGVNPRYFGIRSTAGQTMGIYRDPTFGRTTFLEQFHDMASWLAGMELKTPEEIMANKDRILNVLDAFKAPEQLIKHQLTKPDDLIKQLGWKDFWTGYFAQNLLGPLVLTKKIMGDTAATLYRPLIEKPMERMLYKGLSTLYENPFGLTINDIPVPGESVAQLYGYRSGWMRAFSYIKDRDWAGLAESTGVGSLKRQSLGDFLDQRFGKAGAIFGDVVSAIPNSIKVLTNAARLAAFESETTSRLFREGVQLGKTGDDLANWIEMGRRNLSPQMMKAGLSFADKGTFTDAPGAFASWVSQGLNSFPTMKFDVPFWRIPFNLERFAYQRSPILSLLSAQNIKDIRQGGIEGVDAISKIMVGNIIGGGLIMGGRAGWLTGSGPNDPRVRSEAIQSRAFPPFSIWNPVAGNWFDYSLIHPLKPFLGTAADLGYLWNALPWNEGAIKNMENAFSAFGAATFRNFGDNPFFTGVTDAAKGIEEIASGQLSVNKAMEKSVGNFITGFIPLSATWRYVAQTLDPGIKEVHGVMDVVASSIPGLRSGLYPKRDIYGQEEKLPDVYGPRMFSIARSRDGTEDPIKKEDLRLQMSFNDQADHIGGPVEAADPTKIVSKTGVPLNPDEQDFRDKRLGELYYQHVGEFQNSPSYQGMLDVERIKERHNIRGQARSQATFETADKFPAFKQRLDDHMRAGDTSITVDSPIGQGVQDYQAIRQTEQNFSPSAPQEQFFPIGEIPARGNPATEAGATR